MKPGFLLIFSILALQACQFRKSITSPADYEPFLVKGAIQGKVERVQEELSFWQQRQQRDPANYIDMMKQAACHQQLFRLRGKIADCLAADSLLNASSIRLHHTDPDILLALSQHSITRHQFRKAYACTEQAIGSKSDPYITTLLQFDAAMELGESVLASRLLQSIKDKSSFDYMIRKAKWEDQQGRLNAAIEWMEQAFDKVKDRNASLHCWALSNLGDYYSHAGRIKDAYQAYLSVLQKDSTYIYALKGIAWIAFSNDHDTAEASRILHYILSQTNMPELWLQLAEIKEWEGNLEEKSRYQERFLLELSNLAYGGMYNKYLLDLYAGELNEFDKALSIAWQEVMQRPTPETYNWLAWVYYLRGDLEEAWRLNQNYVAGKNFEPDALYHSALISQAKGKTKEARKMLEECLESSFELGPLTTQKIKTELAVIE